MKLLMSPLVFPIVLIGLLSTQPVAAECCGTMHLGWSTQQSAGNCPQPPSFSWYYVASCRDEGGQVLQTHSASLSAMGECKFRGAACGYHECLPVMEQLTWTSPQGRHWRATVWDGVAKFSGKSLPFCNYYDCAKGDSRRVEFVCPCLACTSGYNREQDCSSQAALNCELNGGIWDSGNCDCLVTPVLLDLGSGAYRLTDPEGGVDFDFNGDGVASRVAWTAPGSRIAFLVLDRNGNGKVDDGTELFGNLTPQPSSDSPHGFAALAVFDHPSAGGNGDGRISAADRVFGDLRLWIDSNHDGVSQPEELFPLSHFGIVAVDLNVKRSERRDRHGNRFRYRAQVHFQDGRRRFAYDVFFRMY